MPSRFTATRAAAVEVRRKVRTALLVVHASGDGAVRLNACGGGREMPESSPPSACSRRLLREVTWLKERAPAPRPTAQNDGRELETPA